MKSACTSRRSTGMLGFYIFIWQTEIDFILRDTREKIVGQAAPVEERTRDGSRYRELPEVNSKNAQGVGRI